MERETRQSLNEGLRWSLMPWKATGLLMQITGFLNIAVFISAIATFFFDGALYALVVSLALFIPAAATVTFRELTFTFREMRAAKQYKLCLDVADGRIRWEDIDPAIRDEIMVRYAKLHLSGE